MKLPENALLHGGTYRILRFINSGGFGCTYEAEHVMLQKRVAIKEFFVKKLCQRDEKTGFVIVSVSSMKSYVDKLRKKFIEEARALSRMTHPGIVKVTDLFEENGTAYYVMEYISGESLNEKVKKHGAMTESEATYYIRQVCDVLDYVHTHNRLHLDVKPSNIMVDESGNVLLIDYGASQQYYMGLSRAKTSAVGATKGYAPQELINDDIKEFRPATDIYSVGATYYKLLTGETPPSAELLASGAAQLNFPANVSKTAQNAILAAMDKDTHLRPSTVVDFEMILEEQDESNHDALAGMSTHHKPYGDVPHTRKEKKSGSFSKILTICMALLMVVAMIAGYFVINN